VPTFDITGLLAVGEDHRVLRKDTASPHQTLVVLVEATDADGEPVELSLSISNDFRPSDYATAATHGRELERPAKR
jgi:hypothetical protein